MSSNSPGLTSLLDRATLHQRIHPGLFGEAIAELEQLDQIPPNSAFMKWRQTPYSETVFIAPVSDSRHQLGSSPLDGL